MNEQQYQLVAHLRTHALRRTDKPTKLASGIWSYDYLDGKEAMSGGTEIKLAAEIITDLVNDEGISFDAVGGLTMGADALAVAIAMTSDKHWFSVRKKPKLRGTHRRIEGMRLGHGDKVLVVDDVITSGGSLLEAIEAIEATGAQVVAATALVDRGVNAATELAQLDVPYFPMSTYADYGVHPVHAKLSVRDNSLKAQIGIFRTPLRESINFPIIAEIKRTSPSAGDLCVGTDAAALAKRFVEHGAAAISVVTDTELFGGSLQDLEDVSDAVSVPILRKDFIRTEADIRQSLEAGAEAALVILRDLDHPEQIEALINCSVLEVVVEVHSTEELNAAVRHGAKCILVNQRSDPRSAQPTIDYGRATALAREFHQHDPRILRIAASGIGTGTPFEDIVASGYHAALIGETLLKADDPAAKLNEWI